MDEDKRFAMRFLRNGRVTLTDEIDAADIEFPALDVGTIEGAFFYVAVPQGPKWFHVWLAAAVGLIVGAGAVVLLQRWIFS